MTSADPDQPPTTGLDSHSRLWHDNRYVYPVLSRRARGLSIGVNLTPDKACTFNCVYCQVDRTVPGDRRPVDLAVLGRELDAMLDAVGSGRIWTIAPFDQTPPAMRRVNDIALCGDGEPTASDAFVPAVRLAADAKARRGLDTVRIIVITNATLLHTARFAEALPTLQASGGEVWAKLDAGTEAHYRRVNASGVPFARVLENITALARQMPVVVQTMLLRIDGQDPSDRELDAYVDRLRALLDAGGQIKLVQLYSVARPPAEMGVSELPEPQLRAAADRIARALPALAVEVYPGRPVPPQHTP